MYKMKDSSLPTNLNNSFWCEIPRHQSELSRRRVRRGMAQVNTHSRTHLMFNRRRQMGYREATGEREAKWTTYRLLSEQLMRKISPARSSIFSRTETVRCLLRLAISHLLRLPVLPTKQNFFGAIKIYKYLSRPHPLILLCMRVKFITFLVQTTTSNIPIKWPNP